MLRLVLIASLAVAPVLGGVAAAQTRPNPPAEIGTTDVTARKCAMINIGTPERPRLVKDPACSTGSR